jgi:class 3 adenylate cyclase/tetratricopeptide (TPR) repeat protein
LFADIVGFTGMSESQDPEQVKNLVNSAFSRLAADITNHGGRVDKTIGDALMALFGAPVAHEDDAERAVRAALAMQRTIESFAATQGGALRLRVGINTGEVLVGGIAAGGDFTAMGDAVNVASRLQTSADPGAVVVGPATHRATSAVIAYEELDALQARGREEPVQRWRAIAPLVMPGRRPSQRRSALVGRDHEVALLRSMLSTSLARSRPSVAVMFGEPGVGKTRLAEEVAEMAANDHGALVLEGRCVPYGEANVWFPVAEAVRQACGLTDECDHSDDAVRAQIHERLVELTGLETDDPELDRLVNGLVYVLGNASALGDVDPARVPAEVHRSVESLIQGLARVQPLMITLAELHWADGVVLDLINDLLERAVGLPVFLLATARPDMDGRWTAPTGRHNAVTIHLDPLDEDAAAELLAGLLGADASPDVVRLVMERAGGNPLFLEELAGLLSDVPGTGATVNDLPATLRGLVAARIDGLDDAARRLLDDAAVVGRDGRVDALVALAAARGAQLDEDALDELVARELLSEDAGSWSFRSELVREVAYDTLTKAERARRHAALGVWLSERSTRLGREDDELEPIAHHLGIAASLQLSLGAISGVPDDINLKALRAIERAAMASKSRGLHSGSLMLLDRALELLNPNDRANRQRVLLARASAYATLRQVSAGLADIEAVAADLNDEEKAALAHVEMVRGELLSLSGDTSGAIAALDRAIALWKEEGDAHNEAVARRIAGMTYLYAGENAAAEKRLNESLAAFEAVGDKQGAAWAKQNLAWLSFNQGHLDEADARLAQADAAFREIGDWGGLSFVRGLMAWVRMFQGRFEEAGDLAERVLAGDRDRNDKWALGMMLMLLGTVRLFTGRPADAVAPLNQAIDIFKQMDDPGRLLQAMNTKARALASMGRIDDSLALLRELHSTDGNELAGMGVISASIAMQLGDSHQLREVLGVPVDHTVMLGTIADHETGVLHALAELLSGNAAIARSMLEQSVSDASNAGQLKYANAALAIAAAASRDPKAALAAADHALAVDGGTYLDVQMAKAGQALAFAQLDDRRALVVADEIVDRANETSDALAQTTALLLRASVACGLRTDDATEQAADADQALDALGADLPGWRDVFAQAATPTARLDAG